jgi:integrase
LTTFNGPPLPAAVFAIALDSIPVAVITLAPVGRRRSSRPVGYAIDNIGFPFPGREFTGLRASELRGLRWRDLDLEARTLHVRQRADRFNELGPPKSEAGERSLPLPSMVVSELKGWRKDCPEGEAGLVFPNGAGNVESMTNLVRRGLQPTLVAAGVTVPVLDDQGKLDGKGSPIVKAKYTGMHALRHFYASWCINRKADGGLELPPKMVQERMGHASFAITMDTYGHLFPRGDDHSELDEAERLLLRTQ